MSLSLAILIQYRRVTHRQTNTQTHDDGCAVKNTWYLSNTKWGLL